jgi:Zn-dependent protease with chaperone function
MASVSITYPHTPQHVDDAILEPSVTFKQEVFRVLAAIVFFIVVYFAMAGAAILLATASAWAGFALIVAKPGFITLMIGLGLIGLGVMVVFFLFKFLFKRTKTDRSNLLELKESDQPELFAFVRALTKETQTPFPKKIYLTAEVNASVFYDSSFWSMFLPVRKNLMIGLGLVNSTNMSEFKAILAHEFGHFSQRSMKLGSYVYNVNQIIYNMLFDNDGYGRTLESWASVSGYFAFFATITVKIVSGMQWILQKVYAVVNKSYMGLSRQMEFHADTVAAYVSGSDHLISSLRKLEVSNITYNNLFECYNRWIKESLRPDNLYPQHSEVMRQFAVQHAIPMMHGLPQVDATTFSQFNKKRIRVKDQWASHPSTDDREAHLRSLNIYTEVVPVSAWSIFRGVEQLQKQVTETIFNHVVFDTTPQLLNVAAFSQRFQAQLDKHQLNNRYKGYFDLRNITKTDVRKLAEKTGSGIMLNDILNETNLALPYVVDGLKNDLNMLEAIQNQTMAVERFEFNGQRYKKHDAERLMIQLKAELEAAEVQLARNDERLVAFFLDAARKHGHEEQLRKKYSELFIISDAADDDMKKYENTMQDIVPIYHGNLEFAQIRQIMEKVKLHEVLIKDRLAMLIKEPDSNIYFTDADRKCVSEYLVKGYVYFREPHFDEGALALFNDCMNIFYTVISERSFAAKKEVLEMQLAFV